MVGPGHLPQHVRLYLPATAIYWRLEGMRVSGEAWQPLAVSPRPLGRWGWEMITGEASLQISCVSCRLLKTCTAGMLSYFILNNHKKGRR